MPVTRLVELTVTTELFPAHAEAAETLKLPTAGAAFTVTVATLLVLVPLVFDTKTL